MTLLGLGCRVGLRLIEGVGIVAVDGLRLICCCVDTGVFAVFGAVPSLVAFGFTGNVPNGPSWTLRLLGGRPLILPLGVPPWFQALDIAGACLFRPLLLGDLAAAVDG